MAGRSGQDYRENGHRESLFECSVCGTRRASSAVPYDRLGYPVCPVCFHSPGL